MFKAHMLGDMKGDFYVPQNKIYMALPLKVQKFSFRATVDGNVAG